MAKDFIFVGIISVLWCLALGNNDVKTCLNESPCFCKLDEYVEINLTPLNTQLQDTQGNITYFFEGCQDTQLGSNIFNVTTNLTASLFKYEIIAKNNTASSVISAIGKAKDIQFEVDPNSKSKYFIAYKEKESKSSPTIHLVCTEFEKSKLKIDNAASDALILYSPSACKLMHHHGMSAGSVLIIILLVLTIAYFLLGGIALYFIRGARGVEIIPNLDFWKELPGLVKDGIIFVFNGCKTTYVSTADTYDRI